MRVLLGLQTLSAGEVRIAGREPRRGSPHIGYIPQQKALDPDLPLRGRDLVGLGLDGHRPGIGLRGRRVRRARVDAALAAVGGTSYADAPVGRLSGGEQQRLRVAQALVGDPAVLLCDEPLLSLDLAHQASVTALIDQRRRAAGTAVVFVTHEINPILPLVDRVLYLVDGRFRIGPDGRGDDLDGAVGALRHTGRRVARARPAGRGRGGRRGRGALPRGRLMDRLISFDGIGELLALPFVQSALIACAVLGLVAGLLAPLIVARGMSFAVHGTAELAFTGGAAALLAGIGVQVGAVVGAVVAGVVFGLLGLRQRERDSVIGVVLAFGLGLGVLMLALYPGRASNKFGLLTGSIVSIDATNLWVLGGVAVVVIAVLAVFHRRLLFASADAEVATARGRPGADAVVDLRSADRPGDGAGGAGGRGDPRALGHDRPRGRRDPGDGEPAARDRAGGGVRGAGAGGRHAAVAGPGLPVSGYVAAIAFACYVACRIVARVRGRLRRA